MAVRCSACGRLSRDEATCEWCRAEISSPDRVVASGTGEGGAQDATASGFVDHPAASDGQREPVPAGGEPAMAADRALPDAGEAEGDILAESTPLAPWYRDNDTAVILGLIGLQFVLTLWLGGLSSWWSITGFLWLVVGYGVVERLAWSLVLPLVLFALDLCLLLFGVGPRQRAGFYAPARLDFVLYLLRLATWALIFRLREEMD